MQSWSERQALDDLSLGVDELSETPGDCLSVAMRCGEIDEKPPMACLAFRNGVEETLLCTLR